MYLLSVHSERVCYKTAVDKCEDGYRVFLNRRNFSALRTLCPDESEELRGFASERTFQSPRYDCINSKNRTYRYRSSEFCLYNVSISDCESSVIVVEKSGDLQEMDNSGDMCSDYLQLYWSSGTRRFCGSDLSGELQLTIKDTHFMAVFWTNTKGNRQGFKLRARCLDIDTA